MIVSSANNVLFLFSPSNFFVFSCVCLVVQSCMTLLWPHGLQPAMLLCPWGFSRQEYWSGLTCPFSGGLPNAGIELKSPALQVDSLRSKPPGQLVLLCYLELPRWCKKWLVRDDILYLFVAIAETFTLSSSMMLDVGFCRYSIKLRKFSIPILLRVPFLFIMKECWIFVNFFLNLLIWWRSLSFKACWCITLIDFQMFD